MGKKFSQDRCAECSTAFSSSTPWRKYCGPVCQRRAARRLQGYPPKGERLVHEKDCVGCGAKFQTWNSARKYCTHQCNVRNYDRRNKELLYQKKISRLREERKRVPEKWREIQRLRRYGMPLGKYDELVASQRGCCVICGKKPEGALQVDHDHTTGVYRELLCEKCNRMLGFALDDPAILRAAIVYLGKHTKIARIA